MRRVGRIFHLLQLVDVSDLVRICSRTAPTSKLTVCRQAEQQNAQEKPKGTGLL